MDKRLLKSFQVVLEHLLTPLFKKNRRFLAGRVRGRSAVSGEYNYEKASLSLDKVLALIPAPQRPLSAREPAALQRFDVDEADQMAERRSRSIPG